MYFLELVETFSAAHALRDYPGICGRTHGHNWKLRVVLAADATDAQGFTVDYAVLRKTVLDLLHEFDHTDFNDHSYFREVNPTSEKIAEYFYQRLESELPPSVRLESVRIGETDHFSVTFRK